MNHNVTNNESYWDKFYKQDVVRVPSQFCVMIATEVQSDSCLVEFGCGNGRDSLYFGSMGINVCAMDLSGSAVESCKLSAGVRGLSNVHFSQGSIANSHDIATIVQKARAKSKAGKISGYSRFVMHSINNEQESLFLKSIGKNLLSGETVFLEFRSKQDADLDKIFGGHYRRFVDTDEFIRKATEEQSFKLIYQLTGQGMARYKSEDPFVSRIIIEKV